MDVSEATKIVMSRIRSLDLENASRIMGYILIQDRGEQDMVMLALGPDALLLSYVNQAKAYLANANSDAGAIFPQSSPRILVPSSGFHYSNPSSPASFLRNSPNPAAFSAVLNDFDLCDDGGGGVPPPHRRSQSVNDAVILSQFEDGGGGFERRPCSYYLRGFCKNGSACKFLHVDSGGEEALMADEFLRVKGLQPQRGLNLASRSHRPSSSAYSKSINFLNENQRRGPRNERQQTGLEAALTSRSRQIYLTFPHESTFREEDVCGYFSKFGPVQDVRIPHQEKRMFGFVTFAYPETVKRILAKGNPHFVCDSRVLVKPYKDKGKFADKKHQILDRVDVFDPPNGSRMLLTQEMMLMRNLEHQGRRLMDLQLADMRYPQGEYRYQPNLPVGVSIFSPRGSELLKGENDIVSYDADIRDVFQDFESDDDSCLEHILPDNLFSEDLSVYNNVEKEADNPPFGTVSPR